MVNEISNNFQKSNDQYMPGRELDKTTFLKLLTAQLSNQDPLNPSDQDQMINMLSQLSQVEQMTNLSGNMEKLLSLNQLSAIGKNIVGLTDAGEKVEGVVEAVIYKNKVPYMVVHNKEISISNLQKVSGQL